MTRTGIAFGSLMVRWLLCNGMFVVDAPSSAANVSDPTSETSSLELIAPDGWVTMDG